MDSHWNLVFRDKENQHRETRVRNQTRMRVSVLPNTVRNNRPGRLETDPVATEHSFRYLNTI